MAARGASPARPPAGNLGSGPPSQDVTQVRHAANFRTVSRNDPALAEILDTSTYAVIYRYEDGEWKKQKQEGPLFVVRRNKTPEYALFMLNRIVVKNVTVPLVPGEMKVTIIGGEGGSTRMLQVARRGDKMPYGIWFNDGNETIERFRESIVRVCGEPVKPGASASASASAAASSRSSPAPGATTASQPAAGGDGLSRLFAGLTTVPAKSSQSPQGSPQVTQPSYQQAPPQQPQFGGAHGQHSPYPPASGQTPPVHGVPTPPAQGYGNPAQYSHGGQRESTPQQQAAPAPISQPAFRPGETVDDLMKGLLGPAAFGGAPPPQAPPAQTLPAAAQVTPPPGSPAHAAPGPGPTHGRQQSHAQRGHTGSPRGAGTPGNGHGGATPVQQHGGHIQSAPPPSGHSQPAPPPAMQGAMGDALLSTFVPDGVRPSPVPKEHLVATLTHLLQTNPQFGEDVWRAYLARCGVAPP